MRQEQVAAIAIAAAQNRYKKLFDADRLPRGISVPLKLELRAECQGKQFVDRAEGVLQVGVDEQITVNRSVATDRLVGALIEALPKTKRENVVEALIADVSKTKRDPNPPADCLALAARLMQVRVPEPRERRGAVRFTATGAGPSAGRGG